MRRAPLRRTTPLRRGGPPRRRTPLARSTPLLPGPWSRSGTARRPLADGGLRRRSARRSSAAGASSASRPRASRPRTSTPRSLGGCDDPDCVVPLCWLHHRAYDTGRLDLLRYLEPHWRAEVAHAVLHLGLIGALRQIRGRRTV